MRVLLLSPPTIHQNSSPPLGLLCLGAVLSDSGVEVTLIDAAACYKPYKTRDILSEIRRIKPQIIGITSNVIFIKAIYDFILELKRDYDGKIFLGGPHASLFPEEALEHGVDFVVIGEGERTFSEVLKGLDSEVDLATVSGIAYKNEKGEIIRTAKRGLIDKLDDLPFPSFDLADESHYPSWKNWGGFVNTLTSRGCPYSCTYCSRIIFGKKFRARSPANVLDEIEQRNEKWGVENIDFIDDAFSIDTNRINSLCDEILRRKIKFNFKCTTRADFLSRELVQKLREAGCIAVSLGVESANPETLKKIKKRISLDIVEKALSWLNESKIKATLNFMLGFPWERADDIKKTGDFMRSISSKVDHFQDFGLLVPIPGTELYDEFKDKYGYENWWLRGDYASLYRTNAYFPYFRRRGFNDFGLLENGFFKYSDAEKSAIQEIIDLIINHKTDRISSPSKRLLTKLGIFASKLLFKMDPKIEKFLFKTLSIPLKFFFK